MSFEKFGKKWFQMHDRIGDLMTSRLEFRRAVSLFVTYDPQTIHVNKLI